MRLVVLFIVVCVCVGTPQKNLGVKNGQNLVRFRTTSNFDSKYIRNGEIFKIGQVFYLPQFRPRLAKKSDKLWSTNYGGLEVESYPLK